jgi:hypothetical protein
MDEGAVIVPELWVPACAGTTKLRLKNSANKKRRQREGWRRFLFGF